MQLYLSSHEVMFSEMVGVSPLLCTQEEAVRVGDEPRDAFVFAGY